MVLRKIVESNLLFEGRGEDDRINVTAKFADYDWMHYEFDTRFHDKEQGWISVKFEYYGAQRSCMHVVCGGRYYRYDFNSDIFERYIKRYLKKFEKSFSDTYAFYPGNIVLEWFNEIIDVGELAIETSADDDIVSGIHFDWPVRRDEDG